MASKPVAIPHTSRQCITTSNGTVLERQYVFMPSASWEALQRICYASHRSGSQVIQELISNADLGKQKDNTNESRSTYK